MENCIKLRYGNTNTFLVRGSHESILIDTDYAGTLPGFYKAIKDIGITVKDIGYILATHFHPDHIGLFGELMEQGVKLLLLEKQTASVHYSDELFAREPRLGFKPIDASNAVFVTPEESRSFLKELGIDGEIISTPSHSEDSISLILDEGICIVGDLEPYEFIEAYEDNTKLSEDWERILSFNPKLIYYAHANEKRLEEADRQNIPSRCIITPE